MPIKKEEISIPKIDINKNIPLIKEIEDFILNSRKKQSTEQQNDYYENFKNSIMDKYKFDINLIDLKNKLNKDITTTDYETLLLDIYNSILFKENSNLTGIIEYINNLYTNYDQNKDKLDEFKNLFSDNIKPKYKKKINKSLKKIKQLEYDEEELKKELEKLLEDYIFSKSKFHLPGDIQKRIISTALTFIPLGLIVILKDQDTLLKASISSAIGYVCAQMAYNIGAKAYHLDTKAHKLKSSLHIVSMSMFPEAIIVPYAQKNVSKSLYSKLAAFNYLFFYTVLDKVIKFALQLEQVQNIREIATEIFKSLI